MHVPVQAEGRFIDGSEDRVNNLNRAHYSLWCSNYWLTNRVRMIGALVCALVGGFLVASVREGIKEQPTRIRDHYLFVIYLIVPNRNIHWRLPRGVGERGDKKTANKNPRMIHLFLISTKYFRIEIYFVYGPRGRRCPFLDAPTLVCPALNNNKNRRVERTVDRARECL